MAEPLEMMEIRTERVMVDDKLAAVRISFRVNDKFYARQFAITQEVDEEAALQLCKAYYKRVVTRGGVTKQFVREIMQETVAALALADRQIVRNPEAYARAKRDVEFVLQRYSRQSDDFVYVNVYGE